MTYLKAHPNTVTEFTPIVGIAIVDHYQHRQTKVKDGQVRWSVIDADNDLGDIWMSGGRYFSKFSTNEGNSSLDDAINEILLDTGLVETEDFDSYPANDQEFVEFMLATTGDDSVKITDHQPKDQFEAIALPNCVEWLDIGTYGSWAYGEIERSHYRRIGTVKQRRDGIIEYTYHGMAYRSSPTAVTIEDAIAQVKKGFIGQQSHRQATEWREYFGV